ncbi:MAG: hypothetical protein LKE52_03245 [Bacilli bacterium]|jgi:hypothetical protein|nr:hypothetical protein [Bacilli bacterium]
MNEPRFSSGKKGNSKFLLPLLFSLLGLVLGVFLYKQTGKMSLVLLLPFFFCAVSMFLIPEISLEKGQKDMGPSKRNALFFYRQYLLYSSLLSSFQEGYRKALASIPTTSEKDALSDYQEQGGKGDFPLLITKTRKESFLRILVKKELMVDEEVTPNSLSSLEEAISSYEKETKLEVPKTSLFPLCLLPLLSFLAEVLYVSFKGL